MRILFLTSAHSCLDDRIYFHQANALRKDHRVFIHSTFSGENTICDGIELSYDNSNYFNRRSKINSFEKKCSEIRPNVIICSEPIPVLGAEKYKRKNGNLGIRILYDVTEFYPSKKNLQGLIGIKRILKTIALVWLNKKASSRVDGFIFGEHFKSLFYKAQFKRKPFIELPYYQDLSFFKFQMPPDLFTIGYSGKFSEEKGILRFAEVLKLFSEKHGKENWKVSMIGWFENEEIEIEFNKITMNLPIEFKGNQSFELYCKSLTDFSVFMDLRDADTENNLCLPIKLFTYASAGRPIAYSALQAIETAFPNQNFISSHRFDDIQAFVSVLSKYYENRALLETACNAAREFSEKHQWKVIKDKFEQFVIGT